MSTPGKRKRWAAKRATSSSVSRVRIGSDSKLLLSSSSCLKRRRSRGWISTTCGQLHRWSARGRPHLGRRDLQRVGRIVGRQHDAVAVQDQAAVGHDRHDGGAVVLGLLGQVLVADHLQVDQARRQQQEASSTTSAAASTEAKRPREVSPARMRRTAGRSAIHAASVSVGARVTAAGSRPGRARAAAAPAAAC